MDGEIRDHSWVFSSASVLRLILETPRSPKAGFTPHIASKPLQQVLDEDSDGAIDREEFRKGLRRVTSTHAWVGMRSFTDLSRQLLAGLPVMRNMSKRLGFAFCLAYFVLGDGEERGREVSRGRPVHGPAATAKHR